MYSYTLHREKSINKKQCGRVILVSCGNEVIQKTSATLRNNINKSSSKISGAGHCLLYEAGNKMKA